MNDKTYTRNIVEYATHGIDDHTKPNETVEVSLRDLLIVHATLQELVQFFHNSDHYPAIEDVHDYMGSRGSNGAYDLISKSTYDVMGKMLPKHVVELFDEGVFDSPKMPFYFEPKA